MIRGPREDVTVEAHVAQVDIRPEHREPSGMSEPVFQCEHHEVAMQACSETDGVLVPERMSNAGGSFPSR